MDGSNASDGHCESHLKGSCLCGKITYQVNSLASSNIGHCHCTDCRKFHGAAFSTFGETETLEWLSGKENLREFVASNGSKRQFCQICGSSLTFQGKNASFVEFSLATVDNHESGLMSKIKPDAHIFVDSMVPWIDIEHDGLARHNRGRS